MDTSIMELLMDPIKERLIIEIHRKQKATVNDLAESCPDIPRSTIYRHMAKLEKAGAVVVVDTVRKRGTLEKTYSINSDLFGKPDSPPSNEMISIMFSQFCMDFLGKCRNYLEGFEGEPADLRLSFATAPFYATDNELRICMERIGKVIQDMVAVPPSEDRKLYSLGTILMPSQDGPKQP